MGVVYYCENVHLLRHRSECICLSTIYYNMDLVTKTLNCNAKYLINLKLYPTLLDAENLFMSFNFQEHRHWYVHQEIRPFSSEYSTYRMISRTKLCESSFSAGLYFLTQTMLSWQKKEAWVDGLFSTYCLFNKILLDYLKAYHQISPKPKNGSTSDPTYSWYSIIGITRSKCQYTRETTKQENFGQGNQPNLWWTQGGIDIHVEKSCMKILTDLVARELTWNVRGPQFDSHQKLGFSVN